IEEVWAWEWSRYGQFPIPEVLAVELRDFGVEMRSLDDNGGGEDGEDMQVIKSLFSRREQRDRVRRANRGRKQKSERGELFGGFRPRYGFRFVKGKNQRGVTVNVGYEPNPETMPNVARIFGIIAAGGSIHAVQRQFEQAAIPNPSGKPQWSRTTIRNIVNDDCYRPHAVEDLRSLGIPADLLDGLDPSKPYGVHWAGRKRSKFKGRSKKREVYEAPREEWTGVPVALDGSGLDRDNVDRARNRIKDNKSPSKVGDRFWDLSGVLKCAECGRDMTAYRRAKKSGHNHYYRCRSSSTVEVCENRKSHPAERVEDAVHHALRVMVDDLGMLTQKIRESFDAKRMELSRTVSDTAPLIERLADLDRRKEGYWDLAADGACRRIGCAKR
ncbi:MAG TPA: recombinase zinc beta ribbon domain-containing protein, partial [Rubrobacter sp.]|nr:recombinase zinc beta ribbon domain-containing protein [Rubrobacter sp.]